MASGNVKDETQKRVERNNHSNQPVEAWYSTVYLHDQSQNVEISPPVHFVYQGESVPSELRVGLNVWLDERGEVKYVAPPSNESLVQVDTFCAQRGLHQEKEIPPQMRKYMHQEQKIPALHVCGHFSSWQRSSGMESNENEGESSLTRGNALSKSTSDLFGEFIMRNESIRALFSNSIEEGIFEAPKDIQMQLHPGIVAPQPNKVTISIPKLKASDTQSKTMVSEHHNKNVTSQDEWSPKRKRLVDSSHQAFFTLNPSQEKEVTNQDPGKLALHQTPPLLTQMKKEEEEAKQEEQERMEEENDFDLARELDETLSPLRIHEGEKNIGEKSSSWFHPTEKKANVSPDQDTNAQGTSPANTALDLVATSFSDSSLVSKRMDTLDSSKRQPSESETSRMLSPPSGRARSRDGLVGGRPQSPSPRISPYKRSTGGLATGNGNSSVKRALFTGNASAEYVGESSSATKGLSVRHGTGFGKHTMPIENHIPLHASSSHARNPRRDPPHLPARRKVPPAMSSGEKVKVDTQLVNPSVEEISSLVPQERVGDQVFQSHVDRILQNAMLSIKSQVEELAHQYYQEDGPHKSATPAPSKRLEKPSKFPPS